MGASPSRRAVAQSAGRRRGACERRVHDGTGECRPPRTLATRGACPPDVSHPRCLGADSACRKRRTNNPPIADDSRSGSLPGARRRRPSSARDPSDPSRRAPEGGVDEHEAGPGRTGRDRRVGSLGGPGRCESSCDPQYGHKRAGGVQYAPGSRRRITGARSGTEPGTASQPLRRGGSPAA